MAVINRLFCIAGHSASSGCCRAIFYTIRPLNDTSRLGATPGELGGDFELLLEGVRRENRNDRGGDEPFACCGDYLFIYSQLWNESPKDMSPSANRACFRVPHIQAIADEVVTPLSRLARRRD